MKNNYYIYSDNTSTFPIHNGIYIHNLLGDEFYIVEEGVGTYIWSQLDGSKNVEQIIAEVARICRLSKDEIEQDILEFIEKLLEKKLIEVK